MGMKRDLTRISHHTKIVATLGPASSEVDILEQMIRIGLNVVRFNFSHGTAEFHAENARKVREASERAGRQVAIIADLQGPKIRVGKIKDNFINLSEGDTLILDAAFEGEGTKERVGLDYRDLPKDVQAGDVLLLDDGLLTLTVTKVNGSEIYTIVENSAILKSNKGINKQGGGLSAPALTEKDLRDLKTALEIGADYLAVSFVKSASDMELARQLVSQGMAGKGVHPGLIAKIERVEAIQNLEEIIKASDGIMVARGDLAVEVGNAAVPALQKKMIKLARHHRRFTITATQMMESMISNPVPTRAEVSDVANAVLDGTDAVMLSAESAVGKYPFETIRTMALVCQAAENAEPPLDNVDMNVSTTNRIDHTIAAGAVFTAQKIGAKVIVALTESGTTAFQVSRYGINIPIYALTGSVHVQRKMAIYRGVRPMMLDTSKDHETAIQEVEEYLQWRNVVESGDLYVITSGMQMGKQGATNTLQINRAK
ncbi:Pyruvate kinase II [Suttonella ornithocola]|uniref:Pyruvate kinase n=2 Tax=Suttonella ornithocola TaxID=279832 RepID=A0A380N2C2_9GAMM|nr:pyruvate kinase [Suttonella ornithocola]SUO97927.1 Pyruvate kinase II [Suttonella ornithocola]